jgi:hypothetical protein
MASNNPCALKSPDWTDETPGHCDMNKRKTRRSRRYRPIFDALYQGLEPRIVLSGFTFLVTSNADSGEQTLRFAIASADQNPGSTIEFDITRGAPTINLLSPLPPIFSTVTIDGTSQPGYVATPLVTVNGSGAGAKGFGFDFVNGSDGSVVEGLDITGFAVAAIMVEGASNVTIGGPDAGDGNVISGNPGDGILLAAGSPGTNGGLGAANATANTVIEGNAIGTDPTGAGADANGVGILISGATDNTVGGTTATQRNIISGNTTDGIEITGTTTSAPTSGNSIEGNYIGTNAGGTGILPNGRDGINIGGGTTNNTIGGSAGQMNVIAGNTNAGIAITGAGTSGNTIAGNEIGTAAGGNSALANGTGVNISQGATNNTIGGATPGARNVISGNTIVGVAITGAGTSGNTIAGNQIGTAAGGNSALPNGTGVDISQGATNNTIGGTTPGARNVISGNTGDGVVINGSSGIAIIGNFLGIGQNGTAVVANGSGIDLNGGATSNTIGGTAAGDGNVISGNTTAGLSISGAGASATWVAGNLIGTDPSGQSPLGNGIGVLASGGAATTIGGTASGAGNVISGNTTAGIELSGGTASGTEIAGNMIGTNRAGTGAVTRTGESDPQDALQNAGIVIIGSQGNTIGGSALPSRNLISGNYVGVMIAGTGGSGNPNVVLGNLIGIDVSGAKPLGNIVGLYINGAAGNQVGGTGSGEGNVISGNSSVGVEIYGSGSTSNLIEGNIIGLAADGRSAFRGSNGLFVQSVGVFIQAASGNTIGGAVAGAGNVISGNESAGVFILSSGGISQGNSMQGNFIGLAENGAPGPGNNGYGIVLDHAPKNLIVRKGSGANQFGLNGIADIRNYAGPQTGSLAQAALSSSDDHTSAHFKRPGRHAVRRGRSTVHANAKRPGR